MASSDARPVRHVRCPRCHSLLQEPTGVPVYQCGGCGTSLRAKNRSGDIQDVAGASSPSRSGLPPRSTHLGSSDAASSSRSSTPTPDARSSGHQATDTTSRRESGDLMSARRPPPSSGDLMSARRPPPSSGDVASTSSTPDATSSRRQFTDTTIRRESGDLVSARKPGSGGVASTSSTPDATSSRPQGTDTTSRRDLVSARNRVSEPVPLIERKEHGQSTNRGSELGRQRDAEERSASSPRVSVPFPRQSKDAAAEFQEKRRKGGQAELPDAARKKHSGEAAAQPQLAPKSSQAAVSRDAAAAAEGKAPSSPRHELQAENLAPLRQKILKTVDELRGDLSELFSKSPELNPAMLARPPRLPKQQQGHASRGAVASGLPARAARHASAAVDHHGSAVKPGHVAAAPPRGLPSRRYRRCRADPCVRPRPCHHGCCGHQGKPECSSCRGHCCRPRAQEPSAPRRPPAAAAAMEAKRRPPPRHHCRPVLKGAPFIICSSCFKLVQVPADFAVSTNRVRKLRCGSCSALLSYSYRDPGRKKAQDSIDQFSTDGSYVHSSKGYAPPDPFGPFIDGFGLSSYSTEEEQPLHVSRNTSFDTVDGMKGVGRLHQLMGYGSARELLRHSPDLYESFDEQTTPDSGLYDRKGKGVCIDAADDDDDVDDSDDEDSGVLKRSAARGAVWPLPGMLGKGAPGSGAIRIKS